MVKTENKIMNIHVKAAANLKRFILLNLFIVFVEIPSHSSVYLRYLMY